MRKATLLAAVLLSAAVLLAGQPLNVQTDLWATAMNIAISGFPLMPTDMQNKQDQSTQDQRAKEGTAQPPLNVLPPSVQPLNVQTGLWETTMNIAISGLPPVPPDMQSKLDQLPPDQRARIEAMLKSQYGGAPQTNTYKSCVKKEDLNKYPFSDPQRKCTYNVADSTGSKMNVSGTCPPGSDGMKVDFKMQLEAVDSEHVKGTGQIVMTGGGRTTNANYSGMGKWLGATCPADMK